MTVQVQSCKRGLDSIEVSFVKKDCFRCFRRNLRSIRIVMQNLSIALGSEIQLCIKIIIKTEVCKDKRRDQEVNPFITGTSA